LAALAVAIVELWTTTMLHWGVDFSVIVDGKLQLVTGFFDCTPHPAKQ